MGHRRVLFQQVGLAFVLCLAASGRKTNEQPVLVVIQPEAESLGSLKVSITNHSAHKIWFTSCPDPYTVNLTDSNGEIVPYKQPQPLQPGQVHLPLCGRNIAFTIEPGETWTSTSEVSLNDKFELKTGTYSLTLLWHFPWNVRKTAQCETWDTLTVSSNTIPLAITH
jgi:hypothetical protein